MNKVHLFVTDRCNLRCPTCFVAASNRFDNELTTQEWKEIIKELNEFQYITETHVEGGEPFLRKDLVEILADYKHKSGIVLATNGTVPYKLKYDELKEIKRLSFSIESYNQEHHQAIKNSDLGQVIKNLERFKSAEFYVNTNTVLTTLNYQDLPEIARRGVELGIPMARFALFEQVGRGLGHPELALSEEQYKETLRLYQKAMEDYRGRIILTLGLPVYAWTLRKMEEYNYSIGPNSSQFAITAEGSVYPCASLINSPEYKWGNVRDESLIEIIKKKKNHPCNQDKCDDNSCCLLLFSSE